MTNPLVAVRARAGLSLVEVLIAILILAVVSSAIVALLPGMTRTSMAANADVQTTQVVQSIFERLQEDWAEPTAPVWSSGISTAQAETRLTAELVGAGLGDGCSGGATLLSTNVTDDDGVVVSIAYGVIATIDCDAMGSLPARSLTRAYGDPR